jgi:hypothetical protein
MKIFLQTLLSVCILLSVVAAHKMPTRRLLAPPPALVKAKEADTEPKSVKKSSQVKQILPKALTAPKPKGPLAPPALVKAKEADAEPKSVKKSSQVKQTLPKALAAKAKGPKGKTPKAKRE